MTQTVIDAARARGDLMFMIDVRGGNFLDQSGNNVVLTVPASAELSTGGLRVVSTPASFPLDMSSVQNICVFALVDNIQRGSAVQNIAELTTNYSSVNDGWAVYQDTSTPPRFYGAYRTDGSITNDYAVNDEKAGLSFISAHIDRRLSYESVKPYQLGILDGTSATDNNTNDGSAFDDGTVYLGARSGGTLINVGLLQAFGIIDMTDYQLSASEQARMYREIRNRKTI